MILLIDNYDSFTFNLVDYFKQLGQECVIMQNNISIRDLEGIVFDSLVLSPGPGVPHKAGNLMQILAQYHLKKPILGICLGHQAICEFFGGKIKKAQKPMHGKVSEVIKNDNPLFYDIPERFKVVRYHSLVCDNLPPELTSIAATELGELMAVKHIALPIWGIQFHPEAALTEYGIEILENWLKATYQLN